MLRIIGSHVLDLDAGTRRVHDLVGKKTSLVVGQPRINHRRRSAGLDVREKIKVLANLHLGRPRTIGDLNRRHTSDHQHDEDTDQHPNQLHTLSTRRRHRRERHSTVARDRRAHPTGPVGGAGTGVSIDSLFPVPFMYSSHQLTIRDQASSTPRVPRQPAIQAC